MWKKCCPRCNVEITYKNERCLKKSVRKNQLCRSCSRTEVVLPPMSEDHKEKIRQHHLKNGVGKWMLWRKLPKETCEKISLSGKGKVRSEETKRKYAASKMGDKNPAKRLEVRIKISETQKRNPRIISEETRRKLSIKSKEAMFRRIEELGITPRPNYNPTACEYFDKLNIEKGWNLRHAMNGGETRILCYYPDAYDKDLNIVVEYDEPRHYDIHGNLKEKDVARMNEIIQKTGCTFYRYNEKRKVLTSNTLTIHEPITIMM